MKARQVKVEAQEIQIDAAAISLTGQTTINGETAINGNLTVSGTVSAANI